MDDPVVIVGAARTPLGGFRRAGAERVQQGTHRRSIGTERLGAGIDGRGQDVAHAVSLNSSRPISMRRISLVPAPIS